ncbi:MAG TPA: IS200/IS605 family transposase [Thermomicrobiaceae bacterium]|nr:IS200/IS605 family transposase [Thermomicrobiaceae bacterium]
MPYWRLFYHLVWATRRREPLIGPELETELHQLMHEAAARNKVTVHASGGVADHVHLVVSIPPAISVADAVQRIKGASAHALNDRIGGGFAWQAEYGATSFAERHLPEVMAYVVKQKQHHASGRTWQLLEELGDGRPDLQPASSRLRP